MNMPMNTPIEEKSLFKYVFLIPVIEVVVWIILSIFALGVTSASMIGSDDSYGVSSGLAGTSMLMVIVGTIISIGGLVYYLILWTGVSKDINTMCAGDTQSAPLMSFVLVFLISLIPFGFIYFFYYVYNMQDKMSRNAQRYGVALKWSSAAVLLFAIFIPIVAYILLIISFNEMARAYNESNGFVVDPDGNTEFELERQVNNAFQPMQSAVTVGDKQGLLICTAGESAGARIPMNNGESVVLGRDPQVSNVVLRSDKKLSRRHCTVSFRDGMFYVIDYSTNGTRLGNGQKIETGKEVPLGGQGTIKLSDQTEFTVQSN